LKAINRLFPVSVALVWLAACSTSGPVHFYSGEPRPASQTAHVIVPGPITVFAIDGKKVDVPSQEDGSYNIYLLPGVHRIDFRYELYWGSAVSGMIVQSDKVGVETRFAAGKTYEIKYPVPNDETDAHELAANFKASLIERETGRQVAARPVEQLDAHGVKTALVQPSKPAQPVSSPEPSHTSAPPAGIDAATAAHEDAVKRLKFWWLMASPEERAQFKGWMKSVEAAEKTETKEK
jgi:uncharacterized protein YccT (UPF0319 family)